jgi:hypothetical protein
MKRIFLLIFFILPLAAEWYPTQLNAPQALRSVNGGTDFRLTFHSRNPEATHYAINVAIDNGGEVVAFTQLVPRAHLDGVPDRYVMTTHTVYVSSPPEKAKVLRMTVTPITAHAGDAATLQPEQ